jgi:hypothetical protein
MKTNSYGRFSTFALLTAALSLGAQAQTAAPAAKPGTAPVPAKPTAASVASTPVAPTVARPAGSKEAPVTVTAHPIAPAKKPGQEGVTMHGHWIIDLRNPDGTIAEHRDFENALLDPTVPLRVVAGVDVVGDFGITIASTGSYVCTAYGSGSPGPLGSCLVAVSSTAGLGGNSGCAGASAGFCNYTLKEVTNGGGGNGAITLSGTMPVLASGAVTEVGTQIFACHTSATGFATVDPVGCYNQTEGSGYAYGNLTGTSIPALNVTTGQTIAFTVVLTFS